jgi:hypothetical protein
MCKSPDMAFQRFYTKKSIHFKWQNKKLWRPQAVVQMTSNFSQLLFIIFAPDKKVLKH